MDRAEEVAMAGLWEQVGGIFWSVPPVAVPVEDARPLSTIIICGVLAAFVITTVLKYILHKIRPQGWGLRKHLGAVGTAITLAYLAVILPVTWDRAGTLLTMPLNELGDFLAGAFGPVAFFWLVLGFFQQGEELKQGTEALLLQAKELKNSVKQQSTMAKIATEQREEHREASEAARRKRERDIKVKFSISTGSSGSLGQAGKVMNEIRITNEGHQAYNVVLLLEPPFVDGVVEVGDIKSGAVKSLRLNLNATVGTLRGSAMLKYEDADLNAGSDSFNYIVSNGRVEFNVD